VSTCGKTSAVKRQQQRARSKASQAGSQNIAQGNLPVPRKIAGKHQKAKPVAVTGRHGRQVREASAARVTNPSAPASAVIIAQSMRE
jgi:hypothetical protein